MTTETLPAIPESSQAGRRCHGAARSVDIPSSRALQQKVPSNAATASATMARRLVYACGERSEEIEADQRNIRPAGVNWKL